MLKADETLDFHNKNIGHIYTNACPTGLHCVKLYGDTSYDEINWDTKVDFIRASTLMPSNPHAKQLKKWLHTYFTDPLRCEDIQISFCGLKEYGEFNSKVWMTIKNTCPVGQLMSYRELAERSGYGSGASKVVGYAINKNPYMLVVGDHRVVKANGEIWCENDSQRNKLRRLLVKFEMGFTSRGLDDALLEVKERNAATKVGRAKSSGTKREGGAQTKIKQTKTTKKVKATAYNKKSTSRRRKKVDTSEEESESDHMHEDEVEDN